MILAVGLEAKGWRKVSLTHVESSAPDSVSEPGWRKIMRFGSHGLGVFYVCFRDVIESVPHCFSHQQPGAISRIRRPRAAADSSKIPPMSGGDCVTMRPDSGI